MSITYTITTNFGAKDTLPTGDSGKIVKGAEFTTEFQAIKTAFTLAAPAASPTFTGTAQFNAISIGGTTITATPAELNVLDGITASTSELNYVDGVTSNVQTQLDAKSPLASPTFTGTVTMPATVFNNSIQEKQYSLTGTVIDPANGTLQYKSITGSTTFTESLSNGEYVTLMLDVSASADAVWTSMTINWVGGTAPDLETTGYNIIEFWKVNNNLYAAYVGAAGS